MDLDVAAGYGLIGLSWWARLGAKRSLIAGEAELLVGVLDGPV
jgi:hypothetical protein